MKAEPVAPPPPDSEMLAWVRKLRRIGDEMDEVAASMHPSAWHEALRDRREKWAKVAKS